MGSSRMPGKTLENFCGRPLLSFQIDLIQKYNFGFEIVVATSYNKLDKKIANFCSDKKIKYVIGSENNVFSRFCMVAKKFNFNHILRLTADNPLVSYSIMKNLISSHLHKEPDLTSTRFVRDDGTVERQTPKGFSMDIINCKTLLDIESNTLTQFQKEHVIPVFYNGDYNISIVKSPIQCNDELSIDTLKDFNRVQDYTNSLIKKGELYKFLGYEES